MPRTRRVGLLTLLALLFTLLLLGIAVAATVPSRPAGRFAWGVTFSQKASSDLGLDWRRNYLAIIDGLHPAGLRLIAYWDLVEPAPGRFDFRDLDWQVAQAERANIPVLLVVGRKVPRWPELHVPAWVSKDEAAQREQLLSYVAAVVEHYRGAAAVSEWQVENEPFVQFGVTPPADPAFLSREVAAVRAADPRRPVMLTDSGELGWWYQPARLGDDLGVTLYRRVYDPRIGTFTVPLIPPYYSLKARVVRALLRRPIRIVCAEFGNEPWGAKPISEMTPAEQVGLFPPEAFAANVAFARRTGFDTFYLWGAEWWYQRKEEGDARYWDEARAVISSGRPRIER